LGLFYGVFIFAHEIDKLFVIGMAALPLVWVMGIVLGSVHQESVVSRSRTRVAWHSGFLISLYPFL